MANRMLRFFPDREIFVRSDGQVRFVRISTGLQLKAAGVLSLLALVWLGMTGIALVQQWRVERESVALGERAAAVAKSAGRVEAFRSSVYSIAERLEDRQQRLDAIVGRYFGPVRAKPDSERPIAARGPVPEAGRFGQIEQSQIAFAGALSAAAAKRSHQAETTLRRLGINPGLVTRQAAGGVGGPYVPVADGEAALLQLGQSLARLDRLERTVLALPAVKPALPVVLSSTFGVRSDPFNGHAAMHTGLDIKGRFGQPILAAAGGKVVRVGRWSGYGNVVVIDHGHGIETRYGHLAGFTTRPGMIVAPGAQVGKMGSTGRSTGNHLHFEVRINGRAVNPRPFLEASTDVLEIQAKVGQRFAGRSGRS